MTTIRIDAARYEDEDNCLAAAAADYSRHHGLDGWILDPRWEDNQKDVILLTVPSWATPEAMASVAVGYLGQVL